MVDKDIIKQIYNIDNSESIYTYIIPIIIILVVFIFTIIYLIKINLSASKLNWQVNQCMPKYMFVSGFIQKEENEGALDSTYTNFKKCIKKFGLKYKPKKS